MILRRVLERWRVFAFEKVQGADVTRTFRRRIWPFACKCCFSLAFILNRFKRITRRRAGRRAWSMRILFGNNRSASFLFKRITKIYCCTYGERLENRSFCNTIVKQAAGSLTKACPFSILSIVYEVSRFGVKESQGKDIVINRKRG